MREYDFEHHPVMEYRKWERIRLSKYVQSLASPVADRGSPAKGTNACPAKVADGRTSTAAKVADSGHTNLFGQPRNHAVRTATEG